MATTALSAAPSARNVIQFPGTFRDRSPKAEFQRALLSAEFARAEYQLADARSRMAELDGAETHDGEWRDYRDRMLYGMRDAMLALAEAPALDRFHVQLKRRAIGRIWLTAEGEFYDSLRAGIAADEARVLLEQENRKRSRRGGT